MNTAVAIVAATAPDTFLAGVIAYLKSPALPGGFLFAITNGDGYAVWDAVPVPFSGTLQLAGAAASYGPNGNGETVNIPAVNNVTIRVGPSPSNPQDVHLPACSPFKKPLPKVPTREAVCNGQTTQQGLYVATNQFGTVPWWGACWAWLNPSDRAMAARQLLKNGDTICLIQVALDGRALYDEPNQFYSADKFPPLTQTMAQTVALVQEALSLGFAGVWLFLDGDDGQAGYPVAVAQAGALGPALGPLVKYVAVFPGWDGVFYGYTPQQVAGFASAARAAGFIYVGVEGSTGHIPVGNGSADYEPGGLMNGYDIILGEFNDGEFDDSVWQVLPRMGRPYNRPANQPVWDDPNPPFYLATPSPRGPYYFRIFEYYIYGWVRNTPASVVAASKAQFAAMAHTNVIC